MKGFREELRMSVFLILLTAVCTLLLTSANLMYQGVLHEKVRALRMEILRGFGVDFADDAFEAVFEQYVDERGTPHGTYYYFSGEPRQVAVTTAGSGLWSVIELFMRIDLDESEMRELRVLSHGETPGLGGRIEEPAFADQFRDLDIGDGVRLVTRRTGARGEVDAISGASVTSNSVMTIINRAVSTIQSEGDSR